MSRVDEAQGAGETMSEWKAKVAYETHNDGYALLIKKGDDDYVAPIQLVKREPGLLVQAALPSSEDTMGFLRALMNCAWDAGLRPDGFNDTRESMAATKQHLEDMRQLAFYKIGADKP